MGVQTIPPYSRKFTVVDGHVKIQPHVVTKSFHSVAVYQLEWFDLSNDHYKVCSSILRYDHAILNTHYKLLLTKIFLLLQSSYFCRLTSKSSNDYYKVCSPILTYDYTILNTYYKLLLIIWSYLKIGLQTL